MPRVTYVQTNFTAGELSPRMLGRVDIARYQNGAKSIVNGIPVVHGGVMRAWGSRFVSPTKDSGLKRSRLIPYVFNRDQAYVLELGHLYVRVWSLGGVMLTELGTPYSESMLFDVAYVQGADTMFLAHQSVPIYRLRRVTNDEWTLSEAPFVTVPFAEDGHKPAVDIALSETTAGTGRTATASGSVWLAADVGREIWYGTGVAVITAVGSATVATVTIRTDFGGTAIPSGQWKLTGSPQTTCTPNKKDPVGDTITLTLAAAGWRSEDAGKWVRINRGIVQITSIGSSTVANGVIKSALDAVIGAIANSWTLEGGVWNAENGYPGAITLHEQRLVCGGSPEYPQTVWMSRTGEYLNFELGTKDDDAMSFTVSSDQINPIEHLGQVRALIALTYGGEFTLSGGVEKAITPTNIQVKNQSTYGCSKVRPCRIGNELYFVQRANRKIRAMAYRYDTDAYGSPDISVLSEHLTETGIVDMAYQQEPESILWMVREDGILASVTIDRDQDVVGWARHTTDGDYESVATVPNANGEELWMVVKRRINGQDVRYIERFDTGTYTHSAITGADTAGKAVWGDLDHLDGEVVDVLADGIVMPQQRVMDNEITLPRNAKTVEIGLPYTTTIETLRPEVGSPSGASQGNSMAIREVTLRFLGTVGCTLNGDVIPFRKFATGILDQPIDRFTGDYRMERIGWARDGAVGELLIEQRQPMPFHLLCVINKLTIND
ncbi:hypothetical protein [Ectopseudomonas alcaliphila]|uniref:Uncharacterized protein n=1 Tax=Ectopseudomonas alcaliphila TaxID=101564 RepID=A0A1G7JG29_9GAMM|nr:hypothetical protein [Pseudomonas alcaliphila]MDX5990469.1 hypothetical protein [Pseudomonas alcaliphila]MDX5995439.1 hypothetical protein [Pseudomonas alcaliphila]MDX5995484.1 hypothetical protein [Pseudomonas alcaliphila]SDF23843.1 hypothetical protein SAMN05216575_106219 [Pseudomonas alcaliphila]